MKMPTFLRNALVSRQAWLSKLLDPRRDIDRECGHPDVITLDDYKRLFARGDIATRVVTLMPEETWSEDPEIYQTEDQAETEFEAAWKELNQSLPIFTYLQRADILSGIGRYGTLLLGLDDGLALSEPAAGVNDNGTIESSGESRLLYLRPLDESMSQINLFESDPTNPRYGQPKTYQVTFSDITSGVSSTASTSTQLVHWSRMIHIADNRTNSEVYGSPRMEKVFNRLLDIRKIAGGSGEMFWKGGFPGLSLETHPGDEEIEFDADATKEQIEAYMNGLQRYIATIGLSAKSLSVQVADPSPHLILQLKLIATAMAVPWRVLIGSEAAQLASEQDARAWNKRISRRRKDYVDPFILRPFVNRLIAVGVLPQPETWEIAWPDPNTPSEDDRASVSEKRSRAIASYVQSGSDVLIPPFHYLTLVMGMTEEEAESILESAQEEIRITEEEGTEEEVVPAAGE